MPQQVTSLDRARQRAVGEVITVAAEPVAVDLKTACQMLSLSAPAVRGEMQAGRLNAKVYGKGKPLFEVAELRRYVSALPSWEPK